MGLEGDGHGGWYKDGEFVAKTEKGRLKFYNKRQKVGGKDPEQSEKEKNLSSPNTQAPPEDQQQQQQQAAPEQEAQQEVESPDLAAGPPPVPKTKGTLTLAFGRFNPPHAGHQQLMDIAAQSAEQEERNIWEIAPKYDLENLRESYVAKKIFNIGDKVENLNTGMIGRIIRRGANHLICVAENNIMFKSWVKDLREAIVNATTPSGVPSDQRLVGTDAHRKYVETMVPGSSYGLQFINKYKKRK